MEDFIKAADCHKHVKSLILDYIKPDITYTDLCNFIEKNITDYFGENNLHSGIAFPVGINTNNIIAHDSAYIGDNRKIKNKDIIKIDYGTHVNGHIIDSAFTFSFVDDYDNLILATRDATDRAIKMSSVDVLLTELTDEISEVIKSYEINLNNKTYNINPVYGIGGHNIKQYQIHGGKLILSRQPYLEENKSRMEDGEIYAIETFASTGTGDIYQNNTIPITHYMLNNSSNNNLKLKNSKKILNWIKKNRNTLPFSSSWLEKDFGKNVDIQMIELIKYNNITAFPALTDKPNTYTSQDEHTIMITENKTILLC